MMELTEKAVIIIKMGSICLNSLQTSRTEEVVVSNSVRVPLSLQAKGYPLYESSSEVSECESFSENSQFLMLPPMSGEISIRLSPRIPQNIEDEKWNLKTNDNTPPLIKRFYQRTN